MAFCLGEQCIGCPTTGLSPEIREAVLETFADMIMDREGVRDESIAEVDINPVVGMLPGQAGKVVSAMARIAAGQCAETPLATV